MKKHSLIITIILLCIGCSSEPYWNPTKKSVQIKFPTKMRVKHIYPHKGFLKHFKSNTIVYMHGGDYVFPFTGFYSKNRPEIKRVTNLIVRGVKGEKPARILAASQYSPVLMLSKCENVVFDNVVMGHLEMKKMGSTVWCQDGVLIIGRSKNIHILNSTLFGCGTYGLSMYKSSDLYFANSKIIECSNWTMKIHSSNRLWFDNSTFTKNGVVLAFNQYIISKSSNVLFQNSQIVNNGYPRKRVFYLKNMGKRHALFFLEGKSDICLKNCTITNNKFGYFRSKKGKIVIKGNTVIDNDEEKDFSKNN